MQLFKFIKNNTTAIFLCIVQGFAIFGLLCGFTALFLSVFSNESTLWWFIFFVIPLVVFVVWVWWKAIIPWTLKIIDMDSKQKEK